MTCPACRWPVPDDAQRLRTLVLCPSCSRSLVQEGDSYRLSRKEDSADLSDAELVTLRRARRLILQQTARGAKSEADNG